MSVNIKYYRECFVVNVVYIVDIRKYHISVMKMGPEEEFELHNRQNSWPILFEVQWYS